VSVTKQIEQLGPGKEEKDGDKLLSLVEQLNRELAISEAAENTRVPKLSTSKQTSRISPKWHKGQPSIFWASRATWWVDTPSKWCERGDVARH